MRYKCPKCGGTRLGAYRTYEFKNKKPDEIGNSAQQEYPQEVKSLRIECKPDDKTTYYCANPDCGFKSDSLTAFEIKEDAPVENKQL
jgi:predicted RNA-binding Zn-ribbon protein involved in translation (DUF1610 family)